MICRLNPRDNILGQATRGRAVLNVHSNRGGPQDFIEDPRRGRRRRNRRTEGTGAQACRTILPRSVQPAPIVLPGAPKPHPLGLSFDQARSAIARLPDGDAREAQSASAQPAQLPAPRPRAGGPDPVGATSSPDALVEEAVTIMLAACIDVYIAAWQGRLLDQVRQPEAR
jgi:hypothetical protein